MKGFPKTIQTKTDFDNLLGNEEYKEEALEKLRELAAFDDRKATKATTPKDPKDPMSDWNHELIDNPYPLHAQHGFIDTEQKTKADQIKLGWFKIPEVIAVVEKKKYDDVLAEFKESKPEIKPIEKIGEEKV